MNQLKPWWDFQQLFLSPWGEVGIAGSLKHCCATASKFISVNVFQTLRLTLKPVVASRTFFRNGRKKVAFQLNTTLEMEEELLLGHLFFYLKSENTPMFSILIIKNMFYTDPFPKFNGIFLLLIKTWNKKWLPSCLCSIVFGFSQVECVCGNFESLTSAINRVTSTCNICWVSLPAHH